MIDPQLLARSYDLAVSSLWRGDGAAGEHYLHWIEAFWRESCPPKPESAPDGHSVMGGGGNGISWFECAGEIVGYPGNGHKGCYRIPHGTVAPRVEIGEIQVWMMSGTLQIGHV